MTGSATPAPCIFPAMIRPLKCSLESLIEWAIASLETPVPGLPVRQIKSNPSSLAFSRVLGETRRPIGISVRVSDISASLSTGSRLTPMGLPHARFTQVTGFSSRSSGMPAITGLNTSSALNRRRSAPAARSISALVTPPRNWEEGTFSAMMVRPSEARIACFRSMGDVVAKSDADMFSNRLGIVTSFD